MLNWLESCLNSLKGLISRILIVWRLPYMLNILNIYTVQHFVSNCHNGWTYGCLLLGCIEVNYTKREAKMGGKWFQQRAEFGWIMSLHELWDILSSSTSSVWLEDAHRQYLFYFDHCNPCFSLSKVRERSCTSLFSLEEIFFSLDGAMTMCSFWHQIKKWSLCKMLIDATYKHKVFESLHKKYLLKKLHQYIDINTFK